MGLNKLKSHRISTTISQKHWAILEKYAEKYGTQQKALEIALESPEKNYAPSPPLTHEEEVWLRISREVRSAFLLVEKDLFLLYLENSDNEHLREYVAKQKPSEFAMEWYYRKPLKECSLREIVEGAVLILKMQGGADSIDYADEAGYYRINMMHNMGLNTSKGVATMFESLFKTYGAKAEYNISERGVIFKIYKNGLNNVNQ